MSEPWRESADLLKRQFTEAAAKSHGLISLLIEVADTGDASRQKFVGPPWFVARNPEFFGTKNSIPHQEIGPWDIEHFDSTSGDPPFPRALTEAEVKTVIGDDAKIIRTRTGTPFAIWEPARRRTLYLCGGESKGEQFKALATDTIRCLRAIPSKLLATLPEDIRAAIDPPPSLRRYVFGHILNEPPLMQHGWDAVIYQEAAGAVVFVPSPSETNGSGLCAWLLLMHRLAWRRQPGAMLDAHRFGWHENHSFPYEWIQHPESCPLPGVHELIDKAGDAFYSVLGSEQSPMDVFTASVRALTILLIALESPKPSTVANHHTDANDSVLTPRQEAIIKLLSKLKSGRGLEGKEIAGKLPKHLRKSESTLRRHDFPALLKGGRIINTPGIGYHLPSKSH